MSEKKMLQGIASILEETLPEDWSKVVFYAEYAEGAFSIEYYVAGSGKDDFVKCFDQKGVSRASLMKNFMAFRCLVWVSGSGGGGAGRVVWGYGYHVVVHRRPATA